MTSTVVAPLPVPSDNAPVRHKRNFKALQLPQTPRKLETEPRPNESFLFLNGSSSSQSQSTHKEKKKPDLPALKDKVVVEEERPSSRRSLQVTISNALARLEKSGGKMHDTWADADFKTLQELGQGNGGSVVKVQHVPTGVTMAKKVVLIDAKPMVRKQILRELQIMHECHSDYIVSSYGAYLADPNICICMEFMDKGSFDGIYKKMGAIDIQVVAKVAHAVLEGLSYLYDTHRIIHRDIKPSNILCNSEGEIKLCDFGVSGELVNSIANTFVGTSTYMSPERIQGADYSIKSDVWSLGITLIELAHGRFPFNESWSDGDLSDLEEEASGPAATSLSPPSAPALTHSPATDVVPTRTPSKGRSVAQHRDSLQLLNTPAKKRGPAASASPTSLVPPLPGIKTTNLNSSDTHQIKSPLSAGVEGKTKRSKRRSKGVSLHGGGMMMSIIELMHHIVQEDPPRLATGRFPAEADEFVSGCLVKDVEQRKTPSVLMTCPWIKSAKGSTFDLKAWAATF